jgi:molybdopterin-guanine dinucleotide biosynthesis protein A
MGFVAQGMEPLAGIVLCGGQSRRMGRDKALLPWRGQPLLCWQVERLLPVVTPLLVAAGLDQQLPSLPATVRVVRDAEPGRGPLPALAGSVVCLPEKVDGILLLAVDMTGFDLGLVPWLRRRLPGYDAVICQSAGHPQPLAALYSDSAGAALTACLQSGQYAVRAWLQRLKIRWVSEKEWRAAGFVPTCFCNLNTPGDYEAALAAHVSWPRVDP